MKTKILLVSYLVLAVTMCGCNDFLSEQLPQGTMSDEQLNDPKYVDQLIISAYAVWISAEDINSSFSMWNSDVRSDDAYTGGNGPEDGDVFHALEVAEGIMTTNWNISDMWQRLYNCISRANTALALLEKTPDSYELKKQRIAEMRFLRGHGHFLLKRLYKNIPFAVDCNLSTEEYNNLRNTAYTNDQGWQLIADDFKYAFENLPKEQDEVGRPNRAAAAAYLAKTYLYKAYRQDNKASHQVTSINADDLKKVVDYTEDAIMADSHVSLLNDMHFNFRPEEEYENGEESIWAMQYSFNDGTKNGNCNWAYGLIVPNIQGVTDGGCDFYKPSQNLVNAFRVDADGLPLFDSFNSKNYDMGTDYADPRLFLTVGMPGTPYMFNPSIMMDRSANWSRSGGKYGYYVSLKHNVDPTSKYLVKGAWWGSPMNRIVLRYADVMLMRAEALIQLNDGRIGEAVNILNSLRARAMQSRTMTINYESDYGVHINVGLYRKSYDQAQALRMLKMERRLELAMESERFFDLVRWGEAKTVIDKYYREEASRCDIYANKEFHADKNEYLPIPHAQMAASNGNYTQNIGGW